MHVSEHILEQCLAHGMESYPEEACGFISGPREQDGLTDVHRMANLMNEYHARDPQMFTRTNRNAYMIDPLAQTRLERHLKKQGQQIKVIYHTHPDVGAYFSEKDQADALWNGEPRYPGVYYLVCGITQGKPDGVILAWFNTDTRSFDIITL
ncbi:MAG: M67 family metallopeptidase [SAR324 cluster bacterium]|nr:M67 family metallopeptidase [SAR324 cluster bacterium]